MIDQATDPFADIRNKRMGELSPEQKDRSTELWLRQQIGPSESYWHPHLKALFRVIDRLREQAQTQDEALAAARRMWQEQATKDETLLRDALEAIENGYRYALAEKVARALRERLDPLQGVSVSEGTLADWEDSLRGGL